VPFTPCHAAAALPFLRTPLPAAAVVLGTVAPDLPYYAPVGIPRELTHAPIGGVTVDPLLALAALALWWAVFRAPVLDLAPGAVRERMSPRTPLGRGGRLVRSLLLVLAGVLVGVATHLLWDWFTHPAGFVDVAPLWRESIGPFAVYRWLQYLSSAGGLAVLALWAWSWMRRTPRVARPSAVPEVARRAAWIGVAGVGVLVAAAVWIAGMRGGDAPFAPSLVFRTLVIAIGCAGAAAVLVCLAWWVARARLGRRASPAED
jgi:hypothetical protein